jgi:hypothetical protein
VEAGKVSAGHIFACGVALAVGQFTERAPEFQVKIFFQTTQTNQQFSLTK